MDKPGEKKNSGTTVLFFFEKTPNRTEHVYML